MPELPEVEITARLLDARSAGAQIESALAPGINALKTFDPPLSALEGERDRGGAPARQAPDRGRRDGAELRPAGAADPPDVGRAPAAVRQARRAARSHLAAARAGSDDGRELRLREFGSKQAAWVKLLRAGELDEDEALATLGPEAWPDRARRLS